MGGLSWRQIAYQAAPYAGSLAGFWLFRWLDRLLGWTVAGVILASMIAGILGYTTFHCYRRLRGAGLSRRYAFRHCLSWMRS